MPLRQVVAALRDAHARYYELLQPVKLRGSNSSSSSSSSTGSSSNGTAAARGQEVDPADAEVLQDVRVVLTAALDAGEVPSIHGAHGRHVTRKGTGHGQRCLFGRGGSFRGACVSIRLRLCTCLGCAACTHAREA